MAEAEESGPIESEEAQALISPDGGVIAEAEWDFADRYATFIALILSPLTLVTYILTLILSLPFLALCAWYAHSSGPTETVSRTWPFFFLCLMAGVAHFPVLAYELVYVFVVFLVAHVLSAPVGLLVRGPSVIQKNFATLSAFMDFSSVCFSFRVWSDVVAAVIIAGYRQGFRDFVPNYPRTLALDPVYKYVLVTNPWIGKLATRHCNQWTEPLKFVKSEDEAMILLRHNISRALHAEASLVRVDDDVFAAAYPHPPKNRVRSPQTPLFRRNEDICLATAVGVEYAVGVHFARVGHVPLRNSKVGDSEPLSTLASRLAYAVSLSYFNPLHPLTGYVEVNLRPSLRLEHPMWCVVGQGYWPHKALSDLAEPFFLYAPDVSHFNQNYRRPSSYVDVEERKDFEEKHEEEEEEEEYDEETKDLETGDRQGQRHFIYEGQTEEKSELVDERYDYDDDAASGEEEVKSVDESDEDVIKVVVPGDESKTTDFELALDEKELGFSIALVKDKNADEQNAYVIVDSVDTIRRRDLKVNDQLLSIDENEPNSQILAQEDHGLAHFAGLVNRIRQGPRPIHLAFRRYSSPNTALFAGASRLHSTPL